MLRHVRLRELFPREHSPRSDIEIIARHHRCFAIVPIMSVMSSLSREALNTLGTPISIWEMVDPVLGDFLLRRRVRPRDVLPRPGLLNRSLELDFPRRFRSGGAADSTVRNCWQHRFIAHGNATTCTSPKTTSQVNEFLWAWPYGHGGLATRYGSCLRKGAGGAGGDGALSFIGVKYKPPRRSHTNRG